MEEVHPLVSFRQKQKPPLSQAGLAKLLGLSRSFVNRLEAGDRRLGTGKLPEVSEKTGIPQIRLRPDLAGVAQ